MKGPAAGCGGSRRFRWPAADVHGGIFRRREEKLTGWKGERKRQRGFGMRENWRNVGWFYRRERRKRDHTRVA